MVEVEKKISALNQENNELKQELDSYVNRYEEIIKENRQLNRI